MRESVGSRRVEQTKDCRDWSVAEALSWAAEEATEDIPQGVIVLLFYRDEESNIMSVSPTYAGLEKTEALYVLEVAKREVLDG